MNVRPPFLRRARPGRDGALLVATFAFVALAGCHQPTSTEPETSAVELLQTGFPGQVTAAGGTSGEVMAAAGEFQQQGNDQGTPGIPKGSGGNTGGAETGQAQDGDSSLAGAGRKTAAQSPANARAGEAKKSSQ